MPSEPTILSLVGLFHGGMRTPWIHRWDGSRCVQSLLQCGDIAADVPLIMVTNGLEPMREMPVPLANGEVAGPHTESMQPMLKKVAFHGDLRRLQGQCQMQAVLGLVLQGVHQKHWRHVASEMIPEMLLQLFASPFQ